MTEAALKEANAKHTAEWRNNLMCYPVYRQPQKTVQARDEEEEDLSPRKGERSSNWFIKSLPPTWIAQ